MAQTTTFSASNPMDGSKCTQPGTYTGNVCPLAAMTYTIANTDMITGQDPILKSDFSAAAIIQASDPDCYLALEGLACGVAYPQCVNGIAHLPCQSSCMDTLNLCTPAFAKLGPQFLAVLQQTLSNCTGPVSNLDSEPYPTNAGCFKPLVIRSPGSSTSGNGSGTGTTGSGSGTGTTGTGTTTPAASSSSTPSAVGSLGEPIPAVCPGFFLPAKNGTVFAQTSNCASNGCCVPCPIQNYFYPKNSFRTVMTVGNIFNLISAVLSGYIVLSWAVLPGRRRHPGDIVLHFAVAVMLWQAGALFTLTSPEKIQCADSVTIATASNNMLCAAQGVVIMLAVHATVMWAGYMIFNLHATIVWRSSVFERYKPLGVILCWGLPGIYTFIPFLWSKVDATTGLACIIAPSGANAMFFSVQGIIVVPAFFLNIATMIHIMIVARRNSTAMTQSEYSGNGSKDGYGNPKPISARRQVLQLLKMNWRALMLGLIFVTTYVIYFVFFNLVVNVVSNTNANTPWVQSWAVCIVTQLAANGNDQVLAQNTCAAQFASNLPSFPIQVTTNVITSTVGIWIFLIFGANMQLVWDWGYWFSSCCGNDRSRGDADMELESSEWR